MERILDAHRQRREGEIVLAIVVGEDLALVFGSQRTDIEVGGGFTLSVS